VREQERQQKQNATHLQRKATSWIISTKQEQGCDNLLIKKYGKPSCNLLQGKNKFGGSPTG